MKLTVTQQQLINDLRNEFLKLNQTQCSDTGFTFLDLNEIKSKEDEDIKQFNEIELHNAAMNKNQMYHMFEVMDKLDADFKKAGLNLKCYMNREEALRFKKPMSIHLIAYDKTTGKEISISGDNVWIEAKPQYVVYPFKGRNIYKIVGYKYGRIHQHTLIYDSVEEYLNSPKVREEFAIIYRNLLK
jgi:hypothetical protein